MPREQTGSPSFIDVEGLARPPGYSNVVEVRCDRLYFIAGQAAFDKEDRVVGIGDFAAQAEQVFRNLGAALDAVDCTPRHLVKLTVFVRDMKNLAAYRAARDRFFASVTPPARPAITLIEVSRLFAEELMIEIEAVAAR